MEKVWTVYKTTNLVNGKFYIGVHKTSEPLDNYLGSGKYFKYAVEKYGIENFQKEILYIFDTKESAYLMENSLVTPDLIESGMSYNLKLGGQGGFDFINENGFHYKGYDSPTERNRIISPFCQEFTNNLSDEQKDKIREGGKRGLVAARKKAQEMYPHSAFYGKSHTDETKKKIGLASKERIGEKNGVFGKIWITNGIESKMVSPNMELPIGWRKGSPLHGIMLINDGVQNKRIKKGDIIPEGWNKGRLTIKK